jgi:hypothetical protein
MLQNMQLELTSEMHQIIEILDTNVFSQDLISSLFESQRQVQPPENDHLRIKQSFYRGQVWKCSKIMIFGCLVTISYH